MKEKRVSLVVGADGVIGRALADHLGGCGEPVIETTLQPETVSGTRVFLDLGQDVTGWSPPRQVSVAYLCAAVTSLEKIHQEPEHSSRVNVSHTIALAAMLVKSGAFCVFPSTNLVFDGSIPCRKAGDAVCPVTEYGRQKAEAEKQLLAMGDLAAVARFTKVLNPGMKLIKDWITMLRSGECIRPFSDMVMAPVALGFAVEVLHRIAGARSPGIFQASAAKDVTYAAVARHIARRIHAAPGLVQPVKSTDTSQNIEAVPRHTTLDTTRLRVEFGLEPPGVWPTLDAVFGLSG